MKPILFSIFTLISLVCISQKELKDYALSHSLKQNKEQYQFLVLESDKRGPWIHKKDRFYYWYKAQKVMSTQGGSSGQLLHGEFESFHENKQLSKKGSFKKGLKNGEWLYWREDGTLIKTENWKKGVRKGIETHYNTAGIVNEVIQHKGKSIRRENADTLLMDKNNGQKQTIYLKDSLGNVYKNEEKKNGRLHGKVKYFENGKLVRSDKYKNGTLIEPKEKKVKEEELENSTNELETKKWWQFWKKKSETSENPSKDKKVKSGGGLFQKKEKDEDSKSPDSKKKENKKAKESNSKKSSRNKDDK